MKSNLIGISTQHGTPIEYDIFFYEMQHFVFHQMIKQNKKFSVFNSFWRKGVFNFKNFLFAFVHLCNGFQNKIKPFVVIHISNITNLSIYSIIGICA